MLAQRKRFAVHILEWDDYLCSDKVEETAQIYSVGGGYVSRVAVMEAEGVGLGTGISPESVAEKWVKINDLSNAKGLPEPCDHSA